MASDDHIADSDEEVLAASAAEILGVNNQEGQSQAAPRIVRLATQGGDRDIPLERVADAFWLHDLVRQSD